VHAGDEHADVPVVPGGFTALAHAVLLPVREWRAMLVALVLVAVLLAPVIPLLAGDQLEFVLIFVPCALVPLSFIRAARERQRVRTAIGYLAAMALLAALGSIGPGWNVGGALLAVGSMPLLAVPIAYWQRADLHGAIGAVTRLLRVRWKSTVLANIGGWQLLGALIVLPAFALFGDDATGREVAAFTALLWVGVALMATSWARIAMLVDEMSVDEVERAQERATAADGEAGDVEVGGAQHEHGGGEDREGA
jgi:hypothetical protein